MKKAINVSRAYNFNIILSFIGLPLFHFGFIYFYYLLVNFLDFQGFGELWSDITRKVATSIIFLILIPTINSVLSIIYLETGSFWARLNVFFIGIIVFLAIPMVVLLY